MANLDNLQPGNANHTFTPEEVLKGAKESARVRQENAKLKKTLKMCLELKNEKGLSYKELVTLGLIKGAMKGNANNYKVIAEMLGELDNNNDNELNKVNELLEKIEKGANNG